MPSGTQRTPSGGWHLTAEVIVRLVTLEFLQGVAKDAPAQRSEWPGHVSITHPLCVSCSCTTTVSTKREACIAGPGRGHWRAGQLNTTPVCIDIIRAHSHVRRFQEIELCYERGGHQPVAPLACRWLWFPLEESKGLSVQNFRRRRWPPKEETRRTTGIGGCAASARAIFTINPILGRINILIAVGFYS